MATNYDKIAGIYDLLSRIVFGPYIVKAQVCLIKYINPNSKILVVGGGTGWVLEELTKQHPSGLVIDYVESSAKMVGLSEKRNFGGNTVNFITLPIEDFTTVNQYDVIFTPFLFDNFKPDKTTFVFNALHTLLKSGGLWLYADFIYVDGQGTIWQKLLLKIMYFFFWVTSNIETNEIENMEPYFALGYIKIFDAWFYAQFIRSVAYRKL